MRTVIFDLDGTLADTSGDLIAAANACFQGLGHDDVLDPAKDQATAVRGAMAMLRLGFQRLRLDATEIDAQFPILLQHYSDNIDVFTTLYPGAIAAVEELLQAGYKVGICTNKPEGLAETLMRRLRVRDLFHTLIGADTLTVRKPDPGPFWAAVERAGGAREASVLVGDTITDRETAKAAGRPCILVTFGPAGHDVVDLAPEALLHDYSDLGRVVRDLIG